MHWIWPWLPVILAVLSLLVGLRSLVQARLVPLIDDQSTDRDAAWPKLSVIVAGRNEEENVATAIESWLQQDYPNFEILFVNDRSTDATGRLAQQYAIQDARLRVFHIEELPENWLGKTHALHYAQQHARGEWLLFTDADVFMESDVWRKAIHWSEKNQVDHLTVGPQWRVGFWENVILQFMTAGFMLRLRLKEVGVLHPNSFAGIGAFNMVKRKSWKASQGFEWLRLETLDDMGLGLAVKNAGARSGFMVSRGDVRIRIYASLRDMVLGFEKNMFAAAGHFSWVRVFLLATVMIGASWLPLILIFHPTWWWLGVMTYLAGVGTAMLGSRRCRLPYLPCLGMPIGAVLMVGILLRSAWKTWRRGGIVWRETHYPLAKLKANQRVKI